MDGLTRSNFPYRMFLLGYNIAIAPDWEGACDDRGRDDNQAQDPPRENGIAGGRTAGGDTRAMVDVFERLSMTYAAYLERFGEDGIIEWANGEALIHMPPGRRHQNVSGFLQALLRPDAGSGGEAAG